MVRSEPCTTRGCGSPPAGVPVPCELALSVGVGGRREAKSCAVVTGCGGRLGCEARRDDSISPGAEKREACVGFGGKG